MKFMRGGDIKMGKIIAFSNQKGGIGKTTSAVNVAASVALKKKKTLLETNEILYKHDFPLLGSPDK